VGALLCAALAAWANVQFLKSSKQTVKVLVVDKEIQPFTAIAADAVKVVDMIADAKPDDAVVDPQFLKDKFSRTLLVKGDVVRESHLVAASGSNLAARLSVEKAYDKRAMAIQVNASTSVAGTLREGDPVDVLVAVQGAGSGSGSGSSNASNSTLSKIIANHVPVLLVQKSQEGGLGGSSGMTVVLQVTPKQAEEIAFAQAQGMVWLITSPYEGAQTPSTEGVTLKTFMNQYSPKVDEKPAAAVVAPKTGGAGL
jgi:pilus assembly protein CpaB